MLLLPLSCRCRLLWKVLESLLDEGGSRPSLPCCLKAWLRMALMASSWSLSCWRIIACTIATYSAMEGS